MERAAEELIHALIYEQMLNSALMDEDVPHGAV